MTGWHGCRVCGGTMRELFDFGRQPLANAFVEPAAERPEYYYELAVGMCECCTTVQLKEEVPRERVFNDDYPYWSSGSTVMRDHFENTADRLIGRYLTKPDAFMVEIGTNDGSLLRVVADAGVRHVGFEPSGNVASAARAAGVRIVHEFFEEAAAARIRASEGPADLIYAANTLCHTPYISSVFRGIAKLLAPAGVFVFEDPYLAHLVEGTAFDQFYDEHFFYFSVRSVHGLAARHGLELVNVERLPVHGGEIRYTVARPGVRRPSAAVTELLAEEKTQGLADPATFQAFHARVLQVRRRLVALLEELREDGQRVVGYGATAKSATVTNYCGIGPELIPFICDSTVAKQGRLTPGMHIPIMAPQAFAEPYPDMALLFAWNHADEIMAKEQRFRDQGGQWIRYVPDVHIV